MENKIKTVEQTARLIREGRILVLAGEHNNLKILPKGKWIGGTIPYFMGTQGGVFDKEHIFVEDFTDYVQYFEVSEHGPDDLAELTAERFENSFRFVVVPAFSEIHVAFGNQASQLPDLYMTPMIGWVAGVQLEHVGKVKPFVFNGITGKASTDKLLAMHVGLPTDSFASLEIINIFQPGDGPVIRFPQAGFDVENATIDGLTTNFAQYLSHSKIDVRLPLVADYSGAAINVSIQSVDVDAGTVRLFAPVDCRVEYRIASAPEDFSSAFLSMLPPEAANLLASCNCVLNFLHLDLLGKSIGPFTGPFTFGEIGYVLLNQTLVYLRFHSKNQP